MFFMAEGWYNFKEEMKTFLKYEYDSYIYFLKSKIEKEIFILIKKELDFFDDENVIVIVIDFLEDTMYEKSDDQILKKLVDQRKISCLEICEFYAKNGFYRWFQYENN